MSTRQSRRDFFKLAALSTAVVVTESVAQSAAKRKQIEKQPNFIVITADQLQPMALGCYGNNICKTPNLDRFASDGVRFETAVSNMPVCMPGRSVLVSGQYNRTCTGGVSNVSYPSFDGNYGMPEYPFYGRPHLKQVTLPEMLKNCGYYNAVIGKWHIHSWPQDVGFDEYVIPRVHHAHSSQLYTENGGQEFTAPGFSVDFELERAGKFFEQQKNRRQPFFLYYNISPPHPPLADMPKEYLNMYDPSQITIRPNCDEQAVSQGSRYAWDKDMAKYPYKVHRWDYRYYGLHLPFCENLPEGYGLRECTAEYYGAVSWVDNTVGRLLEQLRSHGLVDNTWIIFTSDHGELMGRGGKLGKGCSYFESAGIPLLVKGPALARPGRVCDKQVGSLVDVAPTLLELAGGQIPSHWQGRSLLPMLNGSRDVLDENWGITETNGGRLVSIRIPSHMAEFTVKHGGIESDPVCFFDLRSDPYEMNNLAGSGHQADVLSGLRDIVCNWNKKTPWMNDVCPVV